MSSNSNMGCTDEHRGVVRWNQEGIMFFRKHDSNEWHKGIWHSEIRNDLILDAATRGTYTHARASGKLANDITAFHPDHKDWGNTPEDWPRSVLRSHPPRRIKSDPDDIEQVPFMTHKGRIILDTENCAVRDFPEIPATVSSKVEGWLLYAIMQSNRLITMQDIRARTPRDPLGNGIRDPRGNWDGKGPESLVKISTLISRVNRFKQQNSAVLERLRTAESESQWHATAHSGPSLRTRDQDVDEQEGDESEGPERPRKRRRVEATEPKEQSDIASLSSTTRDQDHSRWFMETVESTTYLKNFLGKMNLGKSADKN